MNKKESNKVNSFNATDEVMKKNESIWKASANVTRQYGIIKGQLALVSVYDQEQNTGQKPSSIVKKDIKNNIIPMAVKISKSAVYYYAGINDKAMEFMVTLNKTHLTRLKENTLLTTLLKFQKIVTPLKDKLSYLNATDIDDFAVMLENLKNSLPKPQVEIDESKTATQSIGMLIDEINLMFKELDKFIAPFEYTHTDFYKDYINSRVVKHLRGKAKEKKDSKAA